MAGRTQANRFFGCWGRLATSAYAAIAVMVPLLAAVPASGQTATERTPAYPLKLDPGYQIFEYACHEGNYGLQNLLTGARAKDVEDLSIR